MRSRLEAGSNPRVEGKLDSMKELGTHRSLVDAIVATDDGWLSAGRDGTIRRWPSGQIVHRCIKGDFVTSFAGRFAGTLHSQVLQRGNEGFSPIFEAMEEGIGDLAAAPDGGVFVCGDDNRVEHRRADGSIVWVAETYKFPYALDVDDDTLFIATWDAYLYPVDLAVPPKGTANEPTELPYPEHPPAPMPLYDVVSLGNGRVAVASHGERGETTLHGWSVGETKPLWEASLDPIYALDFHSGRDLIAAGGDAGVVHFRSADGSAHGSETLPEVRGEVSDAWFPAVAEFDELGTANAVTAVAFDAKGESVLVGTSSGVLIRVPVPD